MRFPQRRIGIGYRKHCAHFFFLFFFFKIGPFVKQVCHLMLELFSLKRQTAVANFEDRCWFVLVIK